MFSPSDIEYIRSRGTTEEKIAAQIGRASCRERVCHNV